MNKRELNIEETLRLCGLTGTALNNFAFILRNEDGFESANCKYQEFKELVSAIKQESEMFDSYPIKKIRKLSSLVESLINPPSATTERILQGIIESQKKRKVPEIRFQSCANKVLLRKTYGLQSGFYVISADPNVGKTGIITQLTADILLNNDDSQVILVTLDDIKLKILRRIICSIGYIVQKRSNKIYKNLLWDINLTSSGYTEYDDETGQFTENAEAEQAKIKSTAIAQELINQKRLIVEDGEFTMSKMQNIVYENAKRNCVLIIDAVYNVKTPETDNAKDYILSNFLKRMSLENDLTLIAIKDVAKKQKKKGEEISETGERKKAFTDIGDTKGGVDWEYNVDMMATLYEKDGMVCLNCQKNKIGGGRFIRYYEPNHRKNVYAEGDYKPIGGIK